MSDPAYPFSFRRVPYSFRRAYRRLDQSAKMGGLGQPPLPPKLDVGDQDPLSRPHLPLNIYPPANFENIDKINYVTIPAIAAEATIISFVVPPGRNGIINKVACNFVGGGWVEGSGDVIWRIQVDGTPPPGATDYDNILASLGNPSQPTAIAGFRIFENQLITLVIRNVAVVVAGQRAGGRLLGYTYPREIEEPDIWI